MKKYTPEKLVAVSRYKALFGSLAPDVRQDVYRRMRVLLGALGVLPPAVSALLHNSSTLLLSLKSMTGLMEESTGP